MTIREMCDAFDVTPRTLRFYEAKELIFPIRQGTKRLFTRRDRARLKLILRGRRFGFALEEMRQLLDLYNLGDNRVTQLSRTIEAARARLGVLKDERAELDLVIRDLEAEIEGAAALLTTRSRAAA
jgi:DNA-binding transcriptional MerR regulator